MLNAYSNLADLWMKASTKKYRTRITSSVFLLYVNCTINDDSLIGNIYKFLAAPKLSGTQQPPLQAVSQEKVTTDTWSHKAENNVLSSQKMQTQIANYLFMLSVDQSYLQQLGDWIWKYRHQEQQQQQQINQQYQRNPPKQQFQRGDRGDKKLMHKKKLLETAGRITRWEDAWLVRSLARMVVS